MVFEGAPTAFNGVIFAVIRGIIGKTYGNVVLLNKFEKALHELSPAAVTIWAIIQIDDQRLDLGKALFDGLPPVHQLIDQTIAGHSGCDGVEKEFIAGRQENAHRGNGGFGMKIMIASFCGYAVFPTSRKGANFDGRLGIERNPQGLLIGICFFVDLLYLSKDRIRFGNFF